MSGKITDRLGKKNIPEREKETVVKSIQMQQQTIPDNAKDDHLLILNSKSVEKLKEVQNPREDKMDEVIARNNLVVTGKDIHTLYKNNLLNDTIIDEYLLLIKRRNQSDPKLPTIAVLTVYFYQRLDRLGVEEGYTQTIKWIKEDLRDKDIILIPINKREHFSLVCVYPKEGKIHYLDSIVGSRKVSNAGGIIKKYMELYYKERGEVKRFNIRIRDDIPIQQGAVDCGVFICQYAERIARRTGLWFSNTSMETMRYKMTYEIINNVIKEEVKVQENQKKPTEGLGKMTDRLGKKGKKNIPGREKETVVKSKKCDSKQHTERKARIKWPPSNSTEWNKLDTDLTMILKQLGSTAENKSDVHPNIIYTICLERFGAEEGRKGKAQNKGISRRQMKSKTLRDEINRLKLAYKEAPELEKETIRELQSFSIKKLRLLKRAETLRKNRRKAVKNREEFTRGPYEYAKKILNPKIVGKIESTKEEVEAYLNTLHSDEKREEELGEPEGLYKYPEMEFEFDKSELKLTEVTDVLKKARAKSAPGPNGVPYKVYKKCPGVARLLWSYLKGMWNKKRVSKSWKRAEGVFIPKEDKAKKVEKFRTISLLNVEGKVNFSIIARRLGNYVLRNKYIDTSIQKGGIPGVSGCLEHTALLSQLIREARSTKKNLAVTWLDIANAYGSIPHKLIFKALEKAHVPDEVKNIIEAYYDDIRIRFTTEKFTTEWQKVEKGIITGCTLSVILFALTMTMLIMSTSKETKGPKSISGTQQRNTRLYMDDITTTTETVTQTHYLLNMLSNMLDWGRMQVKTVKCRSLVIREGKVKPVTVKWKNDTITPITEKPIRYLGKEYNSTLNDTEQIRETEKITIKALGIINRSMLPGRFKVWILQNILLARIMWPLTIYEAPMSKIEEIQKKLTSAIKKWLGLPRSLSTSLMYSRSTKVQLPITALSEEVKAAKVRSAFMMETSKDRCIREANIKENTGRKWKVKEAMEDANSRLRMQEVTGIPNRGREGLGMNPRMYYSKVGNKEKRGLIVSMVREREEEARRVNISNLAIQGACFKWEVAGRNISIWETTDSNLRYLIKSIYDLLPTPANKNRWFNTEEYKCPLCGEEGTLNHIMAGCKTALKQGRYKWRHDNVLRVLAYWIEKKIKENNKSPIRKRKWVNFIRAGEKVKQQTKNEETYLTTARDWKLKTDLESRLKIPSYIIQTNQRPDMVIISESTKQMSIIELTVPTEDRIQISAELKLSRYSELLEECKRRGWRTRMWTVEVGCRGFPAASVGRLLKDIGYRGKIKKTIEKILGTEAENASHHIWNTFHSKNWGTVRNEEK